MDDLLDDDPFAPPQSGPYQRRTRFMSGDPFAPDSQGGPNAQEQPSRVLGVADRGDDEPTVKLPDLTGAYQNVRDRNKALVDRSTEIGNEAPYQPKQRGTGSRILEGITSLFSPHMADAIFEKPEERRYQAHQAQEHQEGRQIQALSQAAQNAEKELQLSEQGPLRQAQQNWYNRRQTPQHDPRTINVKHNGAAHVHQFDTKTGLYDIEAGEPYEKTPAEHNPNDVSLFQDDPDSFAKYEDIKESARAKHDRTVRPTSDESRIALYKKDPATYNAIYGNKGGAGANVDPRILALAQAAAKDELGEVDPVKAMDLYDQYSDRIAKRHGGPQMGGQDLMAPTPGDSPVASHAPTVIAGAQGQGGGKKLDGAKAADYLRKAGGDKNKARQNAKRDGYTF